MSFNSRFKQEFSDIAPLTDNRTICRNVIERANIMKENKKIRFGKAWIAAAAVVTALSAATVTVGAANNWDFNAAFRGIFGGGENSVGEEGFDFERYGKSLDMWYDCDNFRLNIKGICADQTSAYVLYDVVFDEGFDYAPQDGWEDWYLSSVMEAYIPGEEQTLLGRINVMDHALLSQNGNVYSYYVMGRLSDADDTFEGKAVTLDFGELGRAIPTGSEKIDEPYLDCEILDCGVHTEIPVDFPICTESRRLELNEEIDCSEYSSDVAPGTRGVITSLEITPFNWSYFVETDTSWMGKGDGYSFTFSVTLTDGRVISPRGYTQETTKTGMLSRGQFTPLDYDKIESVTICGRTIPLV
ncbi:MAG: DUF4179 domain-containing protein [Oscillospiraceae bacterium]